MLRDTVQVINFQNPVDVSDLDTYYARTVFDVLEKLVGTNIWMFLEY